MELVGLVVTSWPHDHDGPTQTRPTDRICRHHRGAHAPGPQPSGRLLPSGGDGDGGRRPLAGHGRRARPREARRRQPARLLARVRLDHLDRPGHAAVLLRRRVRLGHVAPIGGAQGRAHRPTGSPPGSAAWSPRRPRSPASGRSPSSSARRSAGSASLRSARRPPRSRCGSSPTTRSTPPWRRSRSAGSGLDPCVLVGALVVVFALAEAARFADIPVVPQINWVIGWLGFQVAGFAWQDGRLPTGRALAALAGAVLARSRSPRCSLGPWPAVMLHHGGLDHSPTHPPSTALLLFGLAYSFTAAALRARRHPLARALASSLASARSPPTPSPCRCTCGT